MTKRHDQARAAAANIAYPDVENRAGGANWGKRIAAERLAQHRRPRIPMNLAPWRQWTHEDSVKAIAETPEPQPCPHCNRQFVPRLTYQKYCTAQCQKQAGNQRRPPGRK